MSMNSCFDYGYGVNVNKITPIAAVRYLASHKDTVNKICGEEINAFVKLAEKYKNQPDDLDGYNWSKEDLDFFTPENGDDKFAVIIDKCNMKFDSTEYELFEIMMTLITEVINKEDGLCLSFSESQRDIDSDPAIMLLYALPWQFTETEKKLTKAKFNELFGKHIEELGLKKENIGEVEVEYYG